MGTRKIRLADRLRTNPFSSLFNLVKTTPITLCFSLYIFLKTVTHNKQLKVVSGQPKTGLVHKIP